MDARRVSLAGACVTEVVVHCSREEHLDNPTTRCLPWLAMPDHRRLRGIVETGGFASSGGVGAGARLGCAQDRLAVNR